MSLCRCAKALRSLSSEGRRLLRLDTVIFIDAVATLPAQNACLQCRDVSTLLVLLQIFDVIKIVREGLAQPG